MFPCKFVYRFTTGGSSDSLNRVYSVHAVPQVGETVSFIGGDTDSGRSVVKEVVHYLDPSDGTHEIIVYYGSRSDPTDE